MKTPIFDFVKKYAESDSVRLHMPGHKGRALLGIEAYDITEISGADALFLADGIIKESEDNASSLFGSHVFYSTEGSSLSIRAMVYLAALYARDKGREPLMLATRNVHKSFISALSLVGCEVSWIDEGERASYLTSSLTPTMLDSTLEALCDTVTAVYVTTPDYLGNMLDVEALATVAHKHGALLLVDNAHGAYLRFLPHAPHPMALSADMCADSAHKTLPTLTGGAYLHISKNAPRFLSESAKDAMSLFASTSPSYLILASLDATNGYISRGYKDKLALKVRKIDKLKSDISALGYALLSTEPMKITILAKEYGYTGVELADRLLECGIVSEFSDPDYIVLMPSADTGDEELDKLLSAFRSVKRKAPIKNGAPEFKMPTLRMTPREAALSPRETLPVDRCIGRVLAEVTVGCPPAVPIIVSGEEISEETVKVFKYYGITECTVVK